jgi:hypothetical protein
VVKETDKETGESGVGTSWGMETVREGEKKGKNQGQKKRNGEIKENKKRK